MAYTYDVTTIIGRIRLLIGDTDIIPTTDAQFNDEELQALYNMAILEYASGPAIYEASALALYGWAAVLSSGGSAAITEEKIDDYSYKIGSGMSGSLGGQKKELADKYHKRAELMPAFDWAEFDFVNYGDDEDVIS